MGLLQKSTAIALLGLLACSVHAQALEKVDASSWTYTFSPYAWAAGLSGDAAALGIPKTHIKSNFSSLRKDLDFAAMALFTARKHRFGFFADLTYIKASAGTTFSATSPLQDINVGATALAAMLGAGYAVWDHKKGHVDVIGALRYWDVDVSATLRAKNTKAIHRHDGGKWVDALTGLRAVYYLTDNTYATGWALAGKGGAEFSWDIAAGVGYKINTGLSAQLGYRALGVNYSQDHFHYKMVHKGPVLGLTWRF
ncbi:MAG TPA: hypothetical protein K8U84_04365 [Paenalcaligenes hominis]|uniref:Outer membrane protein beta-barrel domain-containing protein n=1 Tax=Paenalcaligenes hominis TaxID=643674 RepID=A0A9D2VFY9_9BURK|nr:hypothetical protein [Paenalcaligenes hominis]